MNILCTKTALELANLIASGEVSVTEVIEAHLQRYEEVNSKVNAITLILRKSSREAAKKADQLPSEQKKGKFFGVPFSIKENIDCIGSPTTNGIPAFVDNFPEENAPIVTRMLEEGAIPIARTNLPEMGLRISTDNPLRGRTINPWDEKLTAGGSSGGEGVAIATGMSPMGLGNDIGGSLRNPAICNGITALKPSQGRVPHTSFFPPQDGGLSAQLMLSEGPMARSVRDLEAMLKTLSGRHINDPFSIDSPLKDGKHEKKVALVTQLTVWG